MKILELELQSRHLDAIAAFYSNTLGLEISDRQEDYVCFVAGSTKLKFRRTDNENCGYHFAFNIDPIQFEACYQWAKQQLELIPVEGDDFVADFKSWNAKAFYFFDNCGNILECIARFELPGSFPTPMVPPAIISICEIGCVVEEVSAYCQYLETTTGIDYFSRQQPREDFAAMGDDEGLLIVVSNNRPWYPTDHLSQKSPVKIILELGEITKIIALNTT